MNLKKAISVVMIGTMVGTLAAGMATTTTYAADTIKIGWLAPLTGTAAENGQQVTWAAEMIVDKELWPIPSYADLMFEV